MATENDDTEETTLEVARAIYRVLARLELAVLAQNTRLEKIDHELDVLRRHPAARMMGLGGGK